MTDLYLWAENATYNSGEVTVIKYQTGSQNLAGISFKISVDSGDFPDVVDSGSTYQLSDCVNQAKQGTNFPGAAADIYSAEGNKWVLCSGNSSKNIITLAGTVGLSSSDSGTNVLAYLYGGSYSIDSILSAANSSAQSYTSQGWTYKVENPNNAPTEITFTPESELTAGHTGKVGTLATTDADVGDTHTYTLTTTGGAAHATLEIGGANSDEVHVKSTATIAAQDYTFKITTNDGNGGTFSKDFTVTFSAAGGGGGGDVTQTITLSPGYSWKSIYIDIEGQLINNVIKPTSSAASMQGLFVKNTSSSATYVNTLGKFMPPNLILSNSSMYKFNNPIDTDITITISGPLVTNKKTAVTGSSDGIWNWVSYNSNESKLINSVITDATTFDFIKSTKKSATRVIANGGMWVPPFNLTPGDGYKYRAKASKEVTLG
jgi:hypothetical protein